MDGKTMLERTNVMTCEGCIYFTPGLLCLRPSSEPDCVGDSGEQYIFVRAAAEIGKAMGRG